MAMSEIAALQRRIESLEDDLRSALNRINRLETRMVEEDIKLARLEREVQHEHQVIDRMEHGIPVGL